MANYIFRQKVFKKEKVSSFFDLRKELQTTDDYKNLGRSYASPRIQQYSKTISSYFATIKSKVQKQVGLPKYFKNRKTNTTLPSYLVIDGCQYSLSKTKATIPLSRRMRKKYGLLHPNSFIISYNGVLKHKGKQCRGEIHFRNNKFYLYQSVEIAEPKKAKSNIVAGLDLGIKIPIASCTIKNDDLVIRSKRFYNQWLYLTKLISKEQEYLATINRKTSKNLSRLFSIRTKYQSNLHNNIVCKLFRFLRRHNVSKLYVGDIKNIRKNADWGKAGNKTIHNYWSFASLLKKITNLAEQYGIELQLVTEEYTSRTCPICGNDNEKNKKDRIFVCSECGYIDHRDVVGARNIMFKGMHDPSSSVHWQEILPLGVSDGIC